MCVCVRERERDLFVCLEADDEFQGLFLVVEGESPQLA